MFAYPSCLPSATATPGLTLVSTISGSALKRTLNGERLIGKFDGMYQRGGAGTVDDGYDLPALPVVCDALLLLLFALTAANGGYEVRRSS
jgi:hypothetical protein